MLPSLPHRVVGAFWVGQAGAEYLKYSMKFLQYLDQQWASGFKRRKTVHLEPTFAPSLLYQGMDVCLCFVMCEDVCTMVHMWRPEDSLGDLTVLPFCLYMVIRSLCWAGADSISRTEPSYPPICLFPTPVPPVKPHPNL